MSITQSTAGAGGGDWAMEVAKDIRMKWMRSAFMREMDFALPSGHLSDMAEALRHADATGYTRGHEAGEKRAALASAPPAGQGNGDAEKPCHWGGGNDIIWCSTCGAEYAYAKGETRPDCPLASAPHGPTREAGSDLAQSHYELLRECQAEFKALGCKGLAETIETQCQRHLAQGGTHADRS